MAAECTFTNDQCSCGETESTVPLATRERLAQMRGRWWQRTPPSWMRHLVSWRMLRRFDNRFTTCWASLAMWKMGYNGYTKGKEDPWEWWPPLGRCLYPYDYCGKYEQEA